MEADVRFELAVSEIQAALIRRSGMSWSVTVGCGDEAGWIRITAPAERRVGGVPDPEYDSESGMRGRYGFDKNERLPWRDVIPEGGGGDYLSIRDRLVLASLLGTQDVGWDGLSVPPDPAARQEFVSRARGEYKQDIYAAFVQRSAA